MFSTRDRSIYYNINLCHKSLLILLKIFIAFRKQLVGGGSRKFISLVCLCAFSFKSTFTIRNDRRVKCLYIKKIKQRSWNILKFHLPSCHGFSNCDRLDLKGNGQGWRKGNGSGRAIAFKSSRRVSVSYRQAEYST